MSDDETAPEMLERLGTDAMLWAQEFSKTAVKLGYSAMDEGWLISWFANAIENCDVVRCNPIRADLTAALAECERLNKSRNRWGKKYNDCLGKLRLAVMSDSDYVKEIDYQNTRLRADLAAVTAERDRMREALRPFDDHEITERIAEALYVFVNSKPGNIRDFRGQAAHVLAYAYPRIIAKYCAALEGVKEPASPWRDIESAPRDGTRILAFAAPLHGTEILAFSRGHVDYYGVAEWAEADPNLNRPKGVWIWDFLIRPTHWMPLPEPPANTQTGER